ncbi:hypothetical protein T552_01852 [Pneumocystis carinii B80]|uniref:Uncharacterized protein n=1 Tax=Pneumocystis carinii (strain B80) TaxID=1408658 RepID=A0A0W4ZI08_PNEC8|nr:hypothetical protein T552_01852 [Pneumocystis carinii B80]KTW27988.1 hypothetical protein T552_01852 [Pneumocystis carinii B80]
MGSISEPYFLTKIPYPINSKFDRQCQIANVFPKGYHEIVIAINGVGINIYDADSGQIITNYPVNGNVQFSCAPISIREETNKKRKTIAGSVEVNTKYQKLLLWIEKSNLDELQFKFINIESKVINIQLLQDYIISFFESGEIIQYNSYLDIICKVSTDISNIVHCGQIKVKLPYEIFSIESKEEDIVYEISVKNSRIIIINIFQICETTCTKLNTITGILTMDFDTNHRIILTEKCIIYHLTSTHLFTYILTSSNIEFKSKTKFSKELSTPFFLEIFHNHHIIICTTNKILLFDAVYQVFFFSKEVTHINTAPIIIHTSESSKFRNALLVLSNTEFVILSTISSSKNSFLVDMLGKVEDKKKSNLMVINSVTSFERKRSNVLVLESPKKTKKYLKEQEKLTKSFLLKLKKYSLLKDGNKFDIFFFKCFNTKKFTNNLQNKNFNKENSYSKSNTQSRKIELSPQILEKITQMIFLPAKKEDIHNSNKTAKFQILFYPKKTLNYLIRVAPLSLLKSEFSGFIDAIVTLDSSLLLNLFLSSDLLPPRELASALKYVLNRDPMDMKIFKKVLKMMNNYTEEQIVSALKTEFAGNEMEKLINLLGKQILKIESKKLKKLSYIRDELVIYRMLENSLDTIGICGITIQNIRPSFFNVTFDILKRTINEIMDINYIINMLDELIRRAGGHKNINQKYQEFKLNQSSNINLKKNTRSHAVTLSNQLSSKSTLQENHLKTKRARGYQKNFFVGKYSIERLEL